MLTWLNAHVVAISAYHRTHSLVMSKGVNNIKYELGEVVSKEDLIKTGCSWLMQRTKLVREITDTHWVILVPVELVHSGFDKGYLVQVLGLPSSTGLQ